MAHSSQFSVSAPASSGNLGPGFDVLAMALDLRNRVTVHRDGSGTVSITGHGADDLPTDATENLVARCFERAAGRSIAEAQVDLACDNAIPPARGLGSSTAAAACGLIAGWTVADVEWDEDQLHEELRTIDGHPDNAAACTWGGIVLCHDREPEPDVVTLGALDWLTTIVVVPDHQLATARAREVLPATYDRSDVVRSIGSAGLLVGGLLGGHPELVEDALECDVVHEPHRAPLVPELADVRAALATTQALGATLSGAGPSVLVWLEPGDVDQAMGTLAIDFPTFELLPLACAHEGAHLDD